MREIESPIVIRYIRQEVIKQPSLVTCLGFNKYNRIWLVIILTVCGRNELEMIKRFEIL